MIRKLIPAGALAVLILTAGPAAAHVTVQPKTATPGDYTVVDVRVPNETDSADTVRVDLQLPPGFASVSYQQVPGWKVKVKTEKLATPIQTDDGPIDEGVAQVTWTGDGKQGKIPPGAFQDFPLSILVPGKVGQTLTFKALQRYSDGEVVRWIGTPSSDHPAPTVQLVAAEEGTTAHHDAEQTGGTDKAAAGEDAAPGHDEDAGDDDGTDGLAVAALIVGALGVLLGAGGLAVGRRRTAA
jgi:uncharacterized protein YcnI